MSIYRDGQLDIGVLIGQVNADNLSISLEGVAVQSFLYGFDSAGGNWDRIPTSAGGLLVDTELPAAVLLADDTATPTPPAVGAFGMVYDGATWDMLRGDSVGGILIQGPGADGAAVVGNPTLIGGSESGTLRAIAARQLTADAATIGFAVLEVGSRVTIFNGASWDRAYGLAQPNTIAGRTVGSQVVGKTEGKVTYRVTFADLVAVVGVAVQIIGGANNIIRVTKVQFSKPSGAQAPLIFTKNSAAATGGTSTTPTPVPLDSADAVAEAVVRLYTALPTPGASVGNVYDADHATSDVLFETFGDEQNTQGLVLRGVAEALTIVLQADATINGYLEWTEE